MSAAAEKEKKREREKILMMCKLVCIGGSYQRVSRAEQHHHSIV